jgi:hypothetical protein
MVTIWIVKMIHCTLTVHSLYTHCVPTAYSLYTHCTLTIHQEHTHYTPRAHSLYTHTAHSPHRQGFNDPWGNGGLIRAIGVHRYLHERTLPAEQRVPADER